MASWALGSPPPWMDVSRVRGGGRSPDGRSSYPGRSLPPRPDRRSVRRKDSPDGGRSSSASVVIATAVPIRPSGARTGTTAQRVPLVPAEPSTGIWAGSTASA